MECPEIIPIPKILPIKTFQKFFFCVGRTSTLFTPALTEQLKFSTKAHTTYLEILQVLLVQMTSAKYWNWKRFQDFPKIYQTTAVFD